MKKICSVFLLIMSLFILTGCENNNENANLLDDKIDSELDYVEDIIFGIIKSYLLEDYQDENGNVNWSLIKDDFSIINQSSNVMVADFSNKNFSNDDILKFEDLINSVNLAIEEKSEESLFVTLANFYTIVPEYMEKYLGYNPGISIKKIKAINLYSYISCIQDDYENANTILSQTENEYLVLTKNSEYAENNGFVLNKLYIVIEEYRMVLEEKNLNLATIKYLNTLSI